MEKIYSIAEAAEVLGMSIHTLRTYVSKRKIEHLKIGGSVRFKESQLQKIVDNSLVEAI